jgi:predicted Zn finger-like uncharacterized protein
MILTCSKCATRYHVDPGGLGPEGRTVRCASCGHRWTAKPPADAPDVLELQPLGPPKPLARATARRRSPRIAAWLVAALVVLVMAGAVLGRNEIVARYPASAAIYEALRLPIVERLGLEFEQVTSKQLMERGVSVLVVEGEIVNQTAEERDVPPIRVILLDDGGRQLQDETFSSKDASLGAGAKTTFSGRLVNPPNQARNFSITFDVGS